MDLITAWELWEESPSSDVTARNKEKALEAEALAIGISPTKLHDEITDLMRLSVPARHAIKEIVYDYETGRGIRNA